MKRLLAALLVALVSLAPTSYHPLQKSVFPLASYRTDPNTETSGWWNICTAFSINPKVGLFLTAAHCVVDQNGVISGNLRLGEELYPVAVQRVDTVRDIAMFWSDQPAVGLTLRTKPLQFKDELEIPSYQLSWWVFMLTTGRVTNPDAASRNDTKSYMWHSVYGCGGSSGSPVLDKDGKIAGIEQVAVRLVEPCSGVGGAATIEQLADFQKYFPK